MENSLKPVDGTGVTGKKKIIVGSKVVHQITDNNVIAHEVNNYGRNVITISSKKAFKSRHGNNVRVGQIVN